MADIIKTNMENGKFIYQVFIDGGTSITLPTANTYVDKDIVILARNAESETYEPLLQSKIVSPSTSLQNVTPDFGYDGLEKVTVNAMPSGEQGIPIANKGTVINHSIDITPSVSNTMGYISGGVQTGKAISVSAAELVSDTQIIQANTTTDITNSKEVITSVPPLIITLAVTIPTSGQNTISFTGLPSMPRAWTLDIASSTQNVSWNGIYRCISARYDGNKVYTYTAYKGNQGSAIPYIYMADGAGFTQEYRDGTLTFTTNTTGSQTYCGPFLARTYVLMAVCDNDGGTDIYREG